MTARVLPVKGNAGASAWKATCASSTASTPAATTGTRPWRACWATSIYDATKSTIQSLRLVTDRATYAGQGYGVAVRSVP